MADDTLTDEGARTLRTHWFRYLDTIEPLQADLHAYCLRLTRNVWDAEDLVQDTLLKGFGMTARGDLHGEQSPVSNARAYLFRTATNHWLDLQRRLARGAYVGAEEAGKADISLAETGEALGHALNITSPQEFAAFILKDVFDFSLEEIADFIGTTTGTVKSALSRARSKMKDETEPVSSPDTSQKALVRAFVDAMNSHDMNQVIELMAESLEIRVCNVGGGRGRGGDWTDHSFSGISAEYNECDGQPIVVMIKGGKLRDVLRLEGDDGVVTRLIDYGYAPHTLQAVAAKLDLECIARAYHQPLDIIPRMVATTTLPWRTD